MKRLVALFLAMTLFFSGAGEVLAAGASDTNPNGSMGTRTAMKLNGYVASEGIRFSSEKAGAGINYASDEKFSQVYKTPPSISAPGPSPHRKCKPSSVKISI